MSELWYGLIDNPALGIFLAGDQPNPTPDPVAALPTSQENNMPLVPVHRIDLGHVYHVSAPIPKCYENSKRGIRHAHDRGWSIDIDLQKDKLANILADHWQELLLRDAYTDPLGKLPKHATLNTMTPEVWGRLEGPHGIKLITVEEAIALCGELHVKMRLEAKAGNHWTIEDFVHMADVCKQHGTQAAMTMLDTSPNWRDTYWKARHAFGDVRRIRG